MNKQYSSLMEYVEARLEEWALWHAHGNWYGLGYSNTSLEYRLMTEGAITKSTTLKPLPTNTDAEEIEKFVNEMAKHNEQMALALRCQYFSHASLRKKANQIKISCLQLRHYVAMAKQWLAGRLIVTLTSCATRYLS